MQPSLKVKDLLPFEETILYVKIPVWTMYCDMLAEYQNDRMVAPNELAKAYCLLYFPSMIFTEGQLKCNFVVNTILFVQLFYDWNDTDWLMTVNVLAQLRLYPSAVESLECRVYFSVMSLLQWWWNIQKGESKYLQRCNTGRQLSFSSLGTSELTVRVAVCESLI